jgi:hypothetical protein
VSSTVNLVRVLEQRNAKLLEERNELLAALQALIAHRDELKLGDYPAVTAARAAIAKAEGK